MKNRLDLFIPVKPVLGPESRGIDMIHVTQTWGLGKADKATFFAQVAILA